MSIDQSTLNATVRGDQGKGASRRLRNAGQIPAVIYGKGTTPTALSIDPIALRKAIATPHKLNTVITVKLDKGGEKLVLLKDFQQHPVTRQVLHADFQEVKLDQPVRVDVPVNLVGKAVGTGDGGILTQIARVLPVFALPRAIPEKLDVDVTPLKVNQSLHTSDITLPEGIKLASLKDITIATVGAPEGEVPAAAAPAAGAAAAPAAAGAGKAAAPAGGKAAAPAAAAAKPAAKK